MKYRLSKPFLFTVLPLTVLVIGLGFVILPRLKELENRPIPGEITFRTVKPEARPIATASVRKTSSSKSPMAWFGEKYENLMTWKRNPWKRPPGGFGDHYFALRASKDPWDQAKSQELLRRSEAWYQKVLLRYPELAVAMKSIPDNQNGFLKWLDLSDRIKAANPDTSAGITFPKELEDFFSQRAAWNANVARDWIAKNRSLVDEIHAIGLMPERSVNGIPSERGVHISGLVHKNCGEIMFLEARLAAEHGDTAAALESVHAARGLADHLTEVETPTLLMSILQALIQLSLETHVLNDIIPALPAGQVDLVAWEKTINPTVSQPTEFARIVKGEWHATVRHNLLPMLLDPEDPHIVPDAGELIDHLALNTLEIVRLHETATIRDLPTLDPLPAADTSHLSRTSSQLVETLSIGMGSSRKGWDRVQSVSAITQAALSVMQGRAIPQDPVYGIDYRWEPRTRVLSMPAGKIFDELNIKPITVPNVRSN